MDEQIKARQYTREVLTDEVIFDGQTEQGVELDYVLPDYYPEIFKILRCSLTPGIVSSSVSADDKLMLDGVVYIKVLYLAEGSGAVHCVDQRYTYTKIVDIGRKKTKTADPADTAEKQPPQPTLGPQVTITPKADYCNCRAVSSRRIDVRGAVSCKIKAVSEVKYLLPEIPEGLEVKTRDISCCKKTLKADRVITVREDIDTGSSGIGFILHSDAVPKISDVRVIADKAVIKGNVAVSALYGVHDPEASGCTDMERMSAEIPVSVILDVSGLTEEHIISPEITVMNMELNSAEDSGILSCELLLLCRVNAQREETVTVPTDLYSTAFETEHTCSQIKIEMNPRNVSQQFTLHSSVNNQSGEISAVWDCRSEVTNAVCRPSDNGTLSLTGQLCCCCAGKNTEGVPFYIEKQEAFEQSIAADADKDTTACFRVNVTDTGFSIRPDGSVDITSQLDFSGMLKEIRPTETISSVAVYEDKPKANAGDLALRICYTDGSESCWGIAKRYNTTVSAVMRENEIEDENAELSGMILIPTV